MSGPQALEARYREHQCVEVYPGLLLGPIGSLRHVAKLSVTHVLSVYNFDRHDLAGDVDYLQIKIMDVDEANILEILDRAHAFIEEGLQQVGGCVLVHCFAGMSRSVTVTASFLMRRMSLSLQQAMAYLDERYPHPCPNSGFLSQLSLFEKHNCNTQAAMTEFAEQRRDAVDWLMATPEFTRYYSSRHSRQNTTVEKDTGTEKKKDPDFSFECWKCHFCLGDSTSVHDLMNVDILQESGSMFIEQLDWMRPQLLENQISGKLYCPQCHEKLGSFNWAGFFDKVMWHTPAFQLHLNKLDIRSATPAHEVAARHPKLKDSMAASTPLGQTVQFSFCVFDCDGVLVNTEVSSCESLYLCIRDVTGFEIPRKFPDDFFEVFGMDVRSCLEHYNKKFNLGWQDMNVITEKALLSKKEHYEKLTTENGIPAFDGVVPLIMEFRKLQIPYGLASSGHPAKIKRNLEESGLVQLFDPRLVVSASEVDRGKPAPDVYLEAFSRIGCRDCPSSCLVIEDSISGLRAARAAGAFAVGITNSLPRVLLEPHADLVIDKMSEVLEFLTKSDSSVN